MSVIEREATESPEKGESGCLVRPVTTSDVLHRAADLLEEFGWFQGDFCSPGGDATMVMRADSFCAAGAMIRAASELTGEPPRDGSENDPWLDAHYTALAAVVGASDFRDGAIADWNDAPGRTKQEVVARLREAADA